MSKHPITRMLGVQAARAMEDGTGLLLKGPILATFAAEAKDIEDDEQATHRR